MSCILRGPNEEPYYPDSFAKEELVRHRAYTWELRKSNTNGFENLILTLSSASLVFTLTYIKNILDGKAPVYPFLIKGGWVCLGFAILFIILSYLLGFLACEKDMDIYVQRYYYNLECTNPFSPWVNRTHWAAGSFFISGIGLVIAFACFNYTGFTPNGSVAPATPPSNVASKVNTSQQGQSKMSEVKIIQKNIVIDPNDPNSVIKGGFGPKPTPLPPTPPPAPRTATTPKK